MKTALAVLGALLLCAIVVETGATLVKDVHIDKPGLDGHPTAGRPQHIAPYRNRLVKREYHEARLNIDADGFRSGRPTGRLFDDWDGARHNVMIFGGSAAFGWTNDDGDAIAPKLEQAAQRHGLTWRVYNLGIIDYSIHDELPILVDQLREGRIPKAVVFYDGVNEAGRALPSWTNDEALTAPYKAGDYEHLWVAEMVERGQRPNFDNLATVKLAGRLCRRVGLCHWPRVQGTKSAAAETAHAQEAARTYVQYARMVHALARDFDFQALFVLQPIGGCLDDPAGYPYPHLGPPREWQTSYAPKLYAEIVRMRPPGLHLVDLCKVFNEPVKAGMRPFSTPLHLNAEGNAFMAERIFSLLGTAADRPVAARSR